MRFQWVKVLMYEGPPYFVKVEGPTFLHSVPWVVACLKGHGISSKEIKQFTPVLGPGRSPKKRIFYYERPVGQIICGNCGNVVPENNNICISCGKIFNQRLIELTNNGNQKSKKL